jgi:hypothetical protein
MRDMSLSMTRCCFTLSPSWRTHKLLPTGWSLWVARQGPTALTAQRSLRVVTETHCKAGFWHRVETDMLPQAGSIRNSPWVPSRCPGMTFRMGFYRKSATQPRILERSLHALLRADQPLW